MPTKPPRVNAGAVEDRPCAVRELALSASPSYTLEGLPGVVTMTAVRRLSCLLLVACTTGAASALAEDIAFVEPSSELDDGKPATNVWNAVDGKDTTQWCAKADQGGSAILSFGFDQPVTVSHIGLVVAAPKGETLDKQNKRARVITVGDIEHRVEARFKDAPGMQVLELSPPVKGQRIVVEVLETSDGASPNAPLCIAEVLLKKGGTGMTGAQIATKLRSLNTPAKRLLHEWLDDPSAPTRTLLFNVDGTFLYKFEPLLEGRPAKLKGKWTAWDKGIKLETLGKTFTVSSRVTKVDEGGEPTVELVISGDAPHSSMAATFRPAPKRLP